MTMRRKLSLAVTALGGALLLRGCGTALGDARAAVGYSGRIAGERSLSRYGEAKSDLAAARYGLEVKRFRRAMADDPASVEAVNGRAAAYDQLGRYDLAERYYQRALAMDPTSVQTLNNLGYSLLLQGKPELALTFFRDAARIARSEEHTSELQSLMRSSYAVFCLKKKKKKLYKNSNSYTNYTTQSRA